MRQILRGIVDGAAGQSADGENKQPLQGNAANDPTVARRRPNDISHRFACVGRQALKALT
jgi:hypothetical protein